MFNPALKPSRTRKPGKPLPMMCVYRPKKGRERAFLALLRKHWPHLRKLGLATRRKPKVWKGSDDSGRVTFFELIEWRDKHAVDEAHGTPEVFAVWGPMGELVDEMKFYPVGELALA